MKSTKRLVVHGFFLLILFAALTYALTAIDVSVGGEFDTAIGLSSLNLPVFEKFTFDQQMFDISELLGKIVLLILPIAALCGLVQLIARRSFKKVDGALYKLVLFYVVVLGVYLLFDKVVVINNRPRFEDVPSYPSSHTLLAVCLLGTATFLATRSAKSGFLKGLINLLGNLLILAIAACRLMSGVHWATDILASFLLGGALNAWYMAAVNKMNNNRSIQQAKTVTQSTTAKKTYVLKKI